MAEDCPPIAVELSPPLHDEVTSTSDEVLPEKQPLQEKEGEPAGSTLSGIVLPPLCWPKSGYGGYKAPHPRSSERAAITAFHDAKSSNLDLEEPILDEFVIYSTDPKRGGFVPLNDVARKEGLVEFYFDGILRWPGSGRIFYLGRVPFTHVSISGYTDLDVRTVSDLLWIQSTYCRRTEVWYRLGKPAKEYAAYYRLFTWVADLAKHLVDFLDSHKNVTLRQFKHDFAGWLSSHHSQDPSFQQWMAEYSRQDFRHAIVAHWSFLHKQATNIDLAYGDHPLWSEVGFGFSPNPVIEKQPPEIQKTIVTPYVYQSFNQMSWADHLELTELDAENKLLYQRRLREMKFTGKKARKPTVKSEWAATSPVSVPGTSFSISPGDVIATRKDAVSKWKSGDEGLWYAYVQDIRVYEARPARLHVLWLYRPSDTVCADLRYPHPEELFLSDHCNCGDRVFNITEVVKKVPISFYTDRAQKGGFFIRQVYNSSEETFTTLRAQDFACPCRQPKTTPDYKPGDTVLVKGTSGTFLEPAQIVTVTEAGSFEVRELLRRGRDFGDPVAKPNELVYTERFRTVLRKEVDRPCHIRFYNEDDRRNNRIPTPYDRNGNGDAFYILVRETADQSLEPLPAAPLEFRQGFDPLSPPEAPKMRGLNIFSGGGNFDRGLEEGLAVHSEWAVEWGLEQMLTYAANHADPETLHLFCGSVNDYLKKALQNPTKAPKFVAKIGDVTFISAGSPCQGYSLANNSKDTDESQRNSSMIASVAAYIDFYRPKYAILENVTAMSYKRKDGSEERNPFLQLLSTFVGMGYQVRIMNLDAWSFGAPQSRSRLFVILAAPGLHLPGHPPLTHAHPANTRGSSLGTAPNGVRFGQRLQDVPVFDYVTAGQAMKDLPQVGEVMSIPEPDHRSSWGYSTINQAIIESIPKFPQGLGAQAALDMRWLSKVLVKNPSQPQMRRWTRIRSDALLQTVTTGIRPTCKYTGKWVHWAEDRLITVKEARRAQGFPDCEVIIGTPAQQWKIVGNSVCRQVALALGLAIRDAYLKNPLDEHSQEQRQQPLHIGTPPAILTETTPSASPTPKFDTMSQSSSVTSISVDPTAAADPSVLRQPKRSRFQTLDMVLIPSKRAKMSGSSAADPIEL
jgi:DNA (cytosine-5)-methyltransferase 1